jgi:hypothetical protein
MPSAISFLRGSISMVLVAVLGSDAIHCNPWAQKTCRFTGFSDKLNWSPELTSAVLDRWVAPEPEYPTAFTYEEEHTLSLIATGM